MVWSSSIERGRGIIPGVTTPTEAPGIVRRPTERLKEFVAEILGKTRMISFIGSDPRDSEYLIPRLGGLLHATKRTPA